MALNRKNRAKIFHNLSNDCIFALQQIKQKTYRLCPDIEGVLFFYLEYIMSAGNIQDTMSMVLCADS